MPLSFWRTLWDEPSCRAVFELQRDEFFVGIDLRAYEVELMGFMLGVEMVL